MTKLKKEDVQEVFVDSKKYKGLIAEWYIKDYPPEASIEEHPDGCYVICGVIFNHPLYDNGVWFRTSQMITHKKDCVEGGEVETLNSRYTLGKKRKEDSE